MIQCFDQSRWLKQIRSKVATCSLQISRISRKSQNQALKEVEVGGWATDETLRLLPTHMGQKADMVEAQSVDKALISHLRKTRKLEYLTNQELGETASKLSISQAPKEAAVRADQEAETVKEL